ncbi:MULTISPECIES: hypothetical protein [Paenibacillus]|uniref:hypothetical protein n=1 Tax=Paenibacillus TaxID=44249 RepID=UPI00037B1E5E|nr:MULTISPECIES: hypothetical protein [Paenibacillus]
MNLKDEQVMHEQFGVGQVVENDNERITVMFSEEVGRKSFMFPDAFGNHLKMSKSDIQDTLYKAYEAKRKQQAADKLQLDQDRAEEAIRVAAEQEKNRKPARKKPTVRK